MKRNNEKSLAMQGKKSSTVLGNFIQTVEDINLMTKSSVSRAKHLYASLRKSLSGNTLDEWIDITDIQTGMIFSVDLKLATSSQKGLQKIM